MIRKEIGPVACFRYCIIVDKLPKTRSGKIIRNVLRALSNGKEPKVPATIEDATVVDLIKNQLTVRGLGQPVDLIYEDKNDELE